MFEDAGRDELEAQLMGGEVQDEVKDKPSEKESEISESPDQKETDIKTESKGEESETVDIEQMKERLAKAEKERADFQQAIREEREAKKASDRTLQALLEKLEKAAKEPDDNAVQAQAIPNYDEDPAAYLRWQNDQILEDRRVEKAQRERDETGRTQELQVQRLGQAIRQGIDQFAANTPDYNDAAKFIIESRVKELGIMGIKDQAEVTNIVRQEGLQVGAWALERGKSPGELIYELAKAKGYRRTQAESVQNEIKDSSTPNPRPKSLSSIGGSPSGSKESLQARADRILSATSLTDVLALNSGELEKILKEAR
jgi:hypothetical protein